MAKSHWKINKRFKECHDPLTPEEFKELEASIIEEGVRDAIIIWRDQIVDGHHRDKIGTKLGIEVPFKIRTFEDEAAAIKWMLRLQIGRRNLSPYKLKLAIGRLYNVEKQATGGDRKSNPQNGVLNGETATKIAEETGTSRNTVQRAGKRAEAFDKLPVSIKTLITEKPARASDKAVIKMADMATGEWGQLARQVRTGQAVSFDAALGLGPKSNGKPKRKKASREKVTTAQLFDTMQRQHFSGASGLPQSLDQLADACGGKGPNYKAADDGLNTFLKHAKEMRKGKP